MELATRETPSTKIAKGISTVPIGATFPCCKRNQGNNFCLDVQYVVETKETEKVKNKLVMSCTGEMLTPITCDELALQLFN